MLPVIHTHVDEPPRTPPRPEDWALPPISMLQLSEQVEVSEVDARQRAKVIENTLKSFGVDALVREINPGPDGNAVRT
jgi:DNA segregation ATPase FtsK/SpoIIIE-like protein